MCYNNCVAFSINCYRYIIYSYVPVFTVFCYPDIGRFYLGTAPMNKVSYIQIEVFLYSASARFRRV